MVMAVTEMYAALPRKVREFVDRQHRDAYRLLDASRHPRTGLYADAYVTNGENPEMMCSTAAVGVGLIGLAVADAEGWDGQAHEKAYTTLQAVLGELEGCNPARDKKTGFFAHFIHIETGENWNSEFSTIDTALLVTGALFAGEHFKDTAPEIKQMAQQLLMEIDWRVIAAPGNMGDINMVVENGEGTAPLPPFTEYAIAARLARLALPDNEEIGALWRNFWAPERLNELPQLDFRGIPILTDRGGLEQGTFLSSFVHQFPFYLVPEYAESPLYREYFSNACLGDRLKWKELDVPSYVWGYGAGSNEGLHGGYHADKINNSPGNAASAYIAAGFLPVYPEGIYDLYALYELHLPYDRFKNPEDPADEGKVRSAYKYGLHRYSWSHLGKSYPTKVTLVDWSSMLYGLTAFKRGMSFFINRLQ